MKVFNAPVVLGLFTVLVTVSGCTKNNIQRCDHSEPQTFDVVITVDQAKQGKPRVDKETVVACYQDEIVFSANVDDFSIEFKDESPFGKNLGAVQGKAKGKVNVNPTGAARQFKYDVAVPGHPRLDPFIIIRTR